jgi:hypothetical protein
MMTCPSESPPAWLYFSHDNMSFLGAGADYVNWACKVALPKARVEVGEVIVYDCG